MRLSGLIPRPLRHRLGLPLGQHALRSSEPWQIVLCALMGAAIGLVVVAMHEVVAWLHRADFNLPVGEALSAGLGIDPWRIALVPALGGLALGLMGLMEKHFRASEIVDPIEANAIHGGRMSLVESLRLSIATILSNAAGASLGMEAAYSQTGASMLSSLGQALNLRRADRRIFVAAGAGAAIAAAFNAPLAGAFYGYELVLGSYAPAALAQVAIAALTGTLAVRATIGVAPIFLVHPPPVTGVDHWDYLLFVLIGLGSAGVGTLTMRAATWCESLLRRYQVPRWLRPALGGALLSSIALALPQVLGSGHGAIQMLFRHQPLLPLLALLLAGKIAASAISIGAGFRGGLFSSSLYLGCLFGAFIEKLAGTGITLSGAEQFTCMLVGMGAMAASIVGAPVTMVLLVLEVTGDFQVALAVLAGVVVSATITRHTFGYSFATWRFHQRGKPIRGAHDIGWIAELTARRLMRGDTFAIRQDLPLLTLREQVPLGSRSRVFVVNDVGAYAGQIDVALVHDTDINDAAAGLVAADLATSSHDFLHPTQDIRAVLARFEDAELEALPVLSEDRHILGYVSEAFALRRYAQEMEKRRSAELGERDLFK